jgi:hypothetical protein
MPRQSCARVKAAWVRAELRAHLELAAQGKSRAYRRAERASEVAFERARRRGCSWAWKAGG